MQAANYPVYNSKLITIPVVTSGVVGKILFPDQPDLKEAKVIGIAAHSFSTMNTDPNGLAVVSYAQMVLSYLTLVDGNDEFIQGIGLQKFCPMYENLQPFNPGGYIPISPRRISWTKSYVTIAPGTAGDAASYSYVFNVFYMLPYNYPKPKMS
jgi:hypothetical protein